MSGFPYESPIALGPPFLNVLAYGAKGDGTTDDTAAIQAALDEAATLSPFSGLGALVFAPAPHVYMISQLQIPGGVTLAGGGSGTIFKAIAGAAANTHMFVQKDSTNPLFVLRDFDIDGNAANQTNSFDAINLDSSYQTNGSLWGPYSTVPLTWIENLNIWGPPNIGINVAGDNKVRVKRVYCQDAGNDSFATTGTYSTDAFFTECVSGYSKNAGFYLGSSTAHLLNCKSWWCGLNHSGGVVNANASGFSLSGEGNLLVGCEAQDNPNYGFYIGSNAQKLSGCVADRCQNGAVYLGNADSDVEVYVRDLGDSTWVTAVTAYCVGGANIRHKVRARAMSGAVTKHVNSSANTAGLDLRLENEDGTQSVAYAATITPAPYLGGTIIVGTLTGDITVDVPSSSDNYWIGQPMTFEFTQDATGGRTITFGSGYKTSWTPSTTASAVNTISFRYDGTDWVQVSAVTGL